VLFFQVSKKLEFILSIVNNFYERVVKLMNEKIIEVKSHLGVKIRNEYIIQDSDVLVIILPGGKYTTLAPLLYYAYNASLQAGYDVLAIEYGFQNTDQDIILDKITIENMINETKDAVDICTKEKKYKKLIFIGKCIGTFIQNSLINKFRNYDQKHVFLTPWPECIDGMVATNSIVIVGTNDNSFKEEHIRKIKDSENIKVKIIENANHDLEKDDFRESLSVLYEITECIYNFIK